MTRHQPFRPPSRPSQPPGTGPAGGHRHPPNPNPGGGGGGPRGGNGDPSWFFGVHAVAAAWVNPERRCKALLATEAGMAALAPAMAEAGRLRLQRPIPRLVDRTELERKLPQGAVHQGLALEPVELDELGVEDLLIATAERADALLVMLDQVTDPHNVGAILRSAAAFGAAGMIVQARHAPPVTGTLAKIASGAVEHVPIARATNLSRALEQLREAGFTCIGLAEEASAPIDTVPFSGKVVLVLGSEGEGLRRLVAENCDALAALPTNAPIASLNVSNAAAVALYEVARRRRSEVR